MSSPETVATATSTPCRAATATHRVAARFRIQTAGVGDEANVFGEKVGEDAIDDIDKIARVTGFGIARTLLLQDRHGDLGEIVEGQVVDGPAADLIDGCVGRVSPEALAVSDTNQVLYPVCDANHRWRAGSAHFDHTMDRRILA